MFPSLERGQGQGAGASMSQPCQGARRCLLVGFTSKARGTSWWLTGTRTRSRPPSWLCHGYQPPPSSAPSPTCHPGEEERGAFGIVFSGEVTLTHAGDRSRGAAKSCLGHGEHPKREEQPSSSSAACAALPAPGCARCRDPLDLVFAVPVVRLGSQTGCSLLHAVALPAGLCLSPRLAAINNW